VKEGILHQLIAPLRLVFSLSLSLSCCHAVLHISTSTLLPHLSCLGGGSVLCSACLQGSAFAWLSSPCSIASTRTADVTKQLWLFCSAMRLSLPLRPTPTTQETNVRQRTFLLGHRLRTLAPRSTNAPTVAPPPPVQRLLLECSHTRCHPRIPAALPIAMAERNEVRSPEGRAKQIIIIDITHITQWARIRLCTGRALVDTPPTLAPAQCRQCSPM